MSKHQEQIIEAVKGQLDDGEQILAAAFAKPRGATTAAAGGGLAAKAIGNHWAGKQTEGAAAAGIDLGNPGAIAVTATHLLTMAVKVSAFGSIKEVTKVLSRVPLAEVDSLEVSRMGLAGVIAISAGPSAFKLEGKPGDLKELAEAFERAKAGAA